MANYANGHKRLAMAGLVLSGGRAEFSAIGVKIEEFSLDLKCLGRGANSPNSRPVV